MTTLFIASDSKNAGSLLVTMGMMDIISTKIHKVAFFKPIIENTKDLDIEFIRSRYGLDMRYEECYGFELSYVLMMIAQNKLDSLIEQLIDKYKKLEEKYDFIVCQGIAKSSLFQTLDFDINLKIAQNFGMPFINIINAKGLHVSDIIENYSIDHQNLCTQKCFHFATFINRIDPLIYEELQTKLPYENLYLLKELSELDTPTIGDIIDNLKAKKILVTDEDRGKLVKQIKVAALTLDNFLDHIEDGDLVIVPADRSEIIVGLLCASKSQSFANISGIIIPFDMQIHPNILALIHGLDGCSVPIFSVATDTYTTALGITATKASLRVHDKRKIALSLGLFNASVDTDTIESRIKVSASQIVTPMMFQYKITYMAKSAKKRIVLPEAEDDRILRATEIILRQGIADITLLGDPNSVQQRSLQLGVDISGAKIIDPWKSEKLEEYAQLFYESRKEKGLTLQAAKDAMNHKSYFATMMVQLAEVDAMVSGASHTTADTIRPALQIIKTHPDTSIVSSLFFMCLGTQVLVYADCAINQDPDATQLAQIAISTAKTALEFGLEPKIAMLSYSSGDSGSGEDVERVKQATALVKKLSPSLLIDGPIQYDAAIDKDVAKLKVPNSVTKGEANIFIFPDLNTGNNTYKAVQRSTNAIAIGPILQGLNKPVNDLSRGCSVTDIVNTVAITAIQAAAIK